MSVTVTCPNIGCVNHSVLKPVPDQLLGKRTRCKKCGTTFVVAGAVPVAASSPFSFGDATLETQSFDFVPPSSAPSSRAIRSSQGQGLVVVGGLLGGLLTLLGIALVIALCAESAPQSPSVSRETAVAQGATERKPSTKVGQPSAGGVVNQPVKEPTKDPATAPMKEAPSEPMLPPDKPLTSAPTKNSAEVERLNELARLIPIKSLGSVEKLSKIKVVQVVGKASFVSHTRLTEVELTWHGLSDFRAQEKAWGARDAAYKIVLNGEAGYAMGKPIPNEQAALIRNEAYSYSLSNLTPLQDSRFVLKPLEDATFNGTRCKVIEVALPNRPTIKMYFAQDTGLLVKSEFMSFRGKKMLFENHYSDYREMDGVKHWHKLEQIREGKKFATIEVQSVRFFEEVDKSLFVP